MERFRGNEDSYHILIYGVVKTDDIKCVPPFEEFKIGEYTFIGFKFDRINRLYQDYRHDNDILTISNASPSQAMKNLFEETYPHKEAKCYSLIQNVYRTYYTNGVVSYGYWINTKDDDASDTLSNLRGEDINEMTIFCPDHVQYHNTPGYFFYGKLLASLPSTEDEDDYELLATNFMRIYKRENIPSRSECINNIVNACNLIDPKNITISDQPELTVICNCCYCCT